MSDNPAASAATVAETIYPNQGNQGNQGNSAQPTSTTAPEVPAQPTAASPEAAPEPKPETLLAAAEAEPKAEEPAIEPFNPEGLTAPEGITIDPEVFGKFSEIAKAAGISQPTAQALMDLYHSVVSGQETKILDAWKTTREGWVTEVKADREVGGSNLEEVRRTVAKVLDNPDLTDPKFREALEVTGIGDNLAAVRTLYRWAKALTEGGPVNGDAISRRTPRSLAEVMYPNLNTER